MGIIGIILGLSAAAAQSVAYVFSRLFVVDKNRSALQLLTASHLMMGTMSLAVLPIVWSDQMPPVSNYALPLAGVVGFFLVGQIGMFLMMRHTQASRVAPLLGFKIVILAAITSTVMGRHLYVSQWIGVLLCVLATMTLAFAGGMISIRTCGWLLVACLGYSLSDLSIEMLVKSLRPLSLMHASVVGVGMAYTACGLLGLTMIPVIGRRRILDGWQYSLPFSLFWFTSMVLLFACFAYAGVIFGNILQSTRGIMSILIGLCLAREGMFHIERKSSVRLLIGRVLAAALMCVAIWLSLG